MTFTKLKNQQSGPAGMGFLIAGAVISGSRDGGNRAGQYRSVGRMGKEINFSGKWIENLFISPDESYIIYDGESTYHFGDCDLFVSFTINGTWTASNNPGAQGHQDQRGLYQ